MAAPYTDVSARVSARTKNPPLAPVDEQADLRRAFGCFPSGVAAVCADVGDHCTGMLVSSLTSVSMQPPLLSICVQNTSQTWAALDSAERLGVSFLSDNQGALCEQFRGPAPQRLAGVDITVTSDGAVLVPDSTAWFVCSRHDAVEAGDHLIVLLRIERMCARADLRPLVFHGSALRRLAAEQRRALPNTATPTTDHLEE